jgi:hypothetical protein
MSGSSTSNDLKDAVRWLRSWTARKGAERGLRRRIERFHRWADQIEEQAEEIERLREERDEWARKGALYRKAMDLADEYKTQLSAVTERLLAQRSRLRELEQLQAAAPRE